jgi:acyl carrier protein
MDETKQRLTNCFRVVFPELTETEILAASQESVAAWDSVAAITLVNVIEDEFGVELDLDNLSELDSFAKVNKYLQEQLQVG